MVRFSDIKNQSNIYLYAGDMSMDRRKDKPFIVINAASLKENTYEKELFGQEYNDGTISFGALDRANKGTLLIDEVTEIPILTQANILRVLIDQKFKRVNGKQDINVNIRSIFR